MNIFVAGGAGFIGSHLCDALLEKGNTVIVQPCRHIMKEDSSDVW